MDALGKVVFGICGALLVVCMFGIFSGCSEAKKRSDYIKAHSCELTYRYETSERVYCGKACTRPAVQKIYSCDNGPYHFKE